MKKPHTRFTRIQTDVLKVLRAYCKASGAVQSDLVSDAVTAYLKRAGRAHLPRRSKTQNAPNPRRKK